MKNSAKLIGLSFLAIIILIIGMSIGSVFIPPKETINIILYELFGYSFMPIDETFTAILLEIRLPRVLLAFICGAGLSISGVIMQSILKNPLASSYTLGVSSGAALGASITLLFEISIFGIFTMQIFGFAFGMITVILAMGIAYKMDKNISGNAIILTGMAFSLFANALLSIFMAFAKESLQSLVFWQMGSFASKNTTYLLVLYPFVLIIFILVFAKSKEMDILTLGDEQASVTGVLVKSIKWFLITLATMTTGFIVSICGIIGFIDLFIPHMARKIFGAKHKYVLPASFMLGGGFMVFCDLIARAIIPPLELPVGSITAIIGAPFFIYLYLAKRK